MDPVHLEERLEIPIFRGHGAEVTWELFQRRSVILHLGEETTSGHYRALVGKDSFWYLGDDSSPSVPTALHDPI